MIEATDLLGDKLAWVDAVDGPRHLAEALKRSMIRGDDYRRTWIESQLRVLGIGPWTTTGETALREYTPYSDDGTESDFSLLRLRSWLADRMGTVI